MDTDHCLSTRNKYFPTDEGRAHGGESRQHPPRRPVHPLPAGNPLLGFCPEDNLPLAKHPHPGLFTAASSVNAKLWDVVRTLGRHLPGAEAQGSGFQSPQSLCLGEDTWALPAHTCTRLPEPGVWLSKGCEFLSKELLGHSGPGLLPFAPVFRPLGNEYSPSEPAWWLEH